jgi:hypothetical protein
MMKQPAVIGIEREVFVEKSMLVHHPQREVSGI